MTRVPGAITDEELRAVAAELAAEAGVELVVLFGSAAGPHRARARDLDLGLRGNGPLDLLALTNRWIARLGTQAVDLVDLRRADPLLLALAARDGYPLFERDPGAFARFVSLAMRRFADTRKFREAEHAAIHAFLAAREGTA
jgi:predicted nucleotidyltransferase